MSPSCPSDTLNYVFEDKLGHWLRAICGCLSNSTEMLKNSIIVFNITFSCDIDCTFYAEQDEFEILFNT